MALLSFPPMKKNDSLGEREAALKNLFGRAGLL
jgi:hypothetical protein